MSRLAFLVCTAASAVLTARGAVLPVGGAKQLFIDRRFIEQPERVELRMNPPVKCGVVLSGDNPWENGYIEASGTVLEDGGKYRMWYTGTPAARDVMDYAPFRLCYAESDDGIHWTKPSLGIYAWHGSSANNMLIDTSNENGGGVLLDPQAAPDARYKLVGWLHERNARHPHGNAPHGGGLYMYTSPDGLHWTLHPERVFPFDPDTINTAYYDDRTGKYLAFVRIWNPLRRVGVVEMDDIMKPWPYDRNAPARPPGQAHGPVRAPWREVPDAFGTDPDDRPGLDFYTPAAVRYPWADDAYFLFPSAYRHFPEPPLGKITNDGVLDVVLAVSRDGRHYHRASRSAYIGRGLEGSRDSEVIYMSTGMIRRGDEIYQYYGGFSQTHNSTTWSEMRALGVVMMTRQRLDGFVSVDAGDDDGAFVTPAISFSGRRLRLNLDAAAAGDVRVELRDADQKPVPGFTFADSDPLYVNDVGATVTWRHGTSDVGAWSGKPVRLAFRMRAAKLYAFQFTD